MTTIYDIAKKSGFSVTTVSKALNDYKDVSPKTKEKILTIAEELGFRPNSVARSLTMKKSWIIGVFFTDHVNSGFKHPFFVDVIESFKKVVGKKGYDLLFFANQMGEKDISYVDHCKDRNVDGVIILGLDRKDPFLPELIHSGIPCVSVDLDIVGKNAGYICSDNSKGAEVAVKHLYELGHKNIAHISGRMETLAGQQRYIGFQKALEKLKIPFRKDYVVDGDYTTEGGYRAMKQLIELPDPPTAVFCAGDLMAIGAMKLLRDKGLSVPSDVSIIGFDDIDLAEFVTPPLTTIRQNKQELGRKAADALLSLIEESQAFSPIITVPVELVIRGSCGKPPQ